MSFQYQNPESVLVLDISHAQRYEMSDENCMQYILSEMKEVGMPVYRNRVTGRLELDERFEMNVHQTSPDTDRRIHVRTIKNPVYTGYIAHYNANFHP